MKKILFSTSNFSLRDSAEVKQFKQSGYELVFNPYKRRLTEQEIISLLKEGVIGLFAGVEPLNSRVLSGAKHLRVISRCGAGLDNIDLKVANKLGIRVVNTPDAVSLPVAEMTIAVMLNLLRKISEADRDIRAGIWCQKMGNLLFGKVVGIIGLGRIGKKLAFLLRPFGVKLIAYDPFTINFDEGISKVNLKELLVASDIVSLHTSLSNENYHLIGKNELEMMKNSAYLINLARGGLVDEDALSVALKNGVIAGAAIDVYEDEPYQGALLNYDNVILTAHMGSYAVEARVQMEQEALSNLTKEMMSLALLGGKI
jgi:D-3-phosphoglycerate dehydrogenase